MYNILLHISNNSINPSDRLSKIHVNINCESDFKEGALIEPLSVGFHAMQMGATGVIDPSKGSAEEQLKEISGSFGMDVSIETSGNAHAMGDAIQLVKRGGRIVYVGLPTADQVPMDVTAMIDTELDMVGVFRYVNTYPDAIKSLSHH